jgi:hypothetical protein
MQRPVSATAALKQLSPSKTAGTRYGGAVQRVNQVRDDSPYRARSNSVKRKIDDGPSYASVVSKGNNKVMVWDEKVIEDMSVEISKVKSLSDKVGETILALEIDKKITDLFTDINAAVRGIANVQEKIVNSANTGTQQGMVVQEQQVSTMVSLGNIAKKPRPVMAQVAGFVPPREIVVSAPLTEEDREKNRFKEAVQVAESSTLVFNLNMGRVPIMNRDTMATRATLALTSMAAAKEEGNRTSIPCDDTVAEIDDILSLAKNTEFYGKKTKTYTNSKDMLSGSYCTVPVRYEFENKDTCIEAEKLLRERCGANCATPYPAVLRECIRQVIDKVKKDYPDNQVKVAVDTDNLCLKVRRRVRKEGTANRWENFNHELPLPKLALKVDIRKVPDGFLM